MANRAYLTLLGLLLFVPLGCGGNNDTTTDTTRKTGIGGIVVDGNPYNESNYYQRATTLPPGRANAKVVVYDRSVFPPTRIAEATSGSDGRFFVPLPPGSYAIFPDVPASVTDPSICEAGNEATVATEINGEVVLGHANCDKLQVTGQYDFLISDDGRE